MVEKGAVVNADVKSVNLGLTRDALNEEGKKKVGLYLSNSALANIKTWQFQREDDPATFSVQYAYRIEGEPTEVSGNPTVELDLPRLVKVTSRPHKHVALPELGSPLRRARPSRQQTIEAKAHC